MNTAWRWQWMNLGSAQPSSPSPFLFHKTEGGIFFTVFIANHFWREVFWGYSRIDKIYLVNPWILHISWNKNLKLPLSCSSLLLKSVPTRNYRLSCGSVSYMNVSVESERSDRQASRWHHHSWFLELSSKVQVSWGLMFYPIIAKLIRRTNKNPRSHS